jgi:hypothetical protein
MRKGGERAWRATPPYGNARVTRVSATARAGFGSAATRTTAGVEFDAAIELETVHVKIHLNGLGAVQELFIDDIFKTVHIKLLVQIVGLIQSHGQAWTASAAFVQKNPDGTNIFAFKVGRNLFRRRWGNFEHGILLGDFHRITAHGCSAQGVKRAGNLTIAVLNVKQNGE